MMLPSIFGEDLFDDFFTPFYYDDKDEKENHRKEAVRKKEHRIDRRQILRKNRKGYELIVDVLASRKMKSKLH